jgi:putative endonuclease
MPKVFTSDTQKTGELGEGVACRFLMKHGYKILERNYTRKWGEIDIVAQKGSQIHFIEVKAKSVVSISDFILTKGESYRPEDAMHPRKQKRLSRTIQTYLSDKDVLNEWQFDVAVVLLDISNKEAKVEMIENVIL